MSFMVCIVYSISDFLPSFFEKNLKSSLVLPKTIAPSPNEFFGSKPWVDFEQHYNSTRTNLFSTCT